MTGASHIDTSCLIDAQCVTPNTLDVIDQYRHSVAQLTFVVGGESAICTGALINDQLSSGTPYLLTANHCFSTQAAATSLEAFWEYSATSCGAAPPPIGSLPRSSGSALLATATDSDFTFVRLNSIPSGRVFLGWNAAPSAVPPGAILHRISHPGVPHQNSVFVQAYSQSRVLNHNACPGGGPTAVIQSEKVAGDTSPGSSGAPVILAGGFVVGQLGGACGLPDSQCTLNANTIDGAFSATFPRIQQFLAPSQTPLEPCVPDDHTLCLHDRRFEVRVDFRVQEGQPLQPANKIAFTERAGLFWFFNPANVEMLLKVQNACVAPFNRYWVFFAATTNVEFTVTVTDNERGITKQYQNPLGTAALPIQDTQAFATCP